MSQTTRQGSIERAAGAAAPATGRRDTQRERIVRAMTLLTAEHDYASTTIARVITQAGVSRPTFYEYFADKDDCFRAVLSETGARFAARVEAAIDGRAPELALAASLEALVELARVEPHAAKVLFSESLAGGTRALEIRDRVNAELAALVEASYLGVDPSLPACDVNGAILLGGVQRLLAASLREHEVLPDGTLEELLQWTSSYEVPLRDHRWRTLEPVAPPVSLPHVEPMLEPAPLAPGRPRQAHEQVAEHQRQRIMFAAAEISEREGYADTTIGAVTKRAGVDNRVFHSLFADKEHLFRAIHEMHFQRMMALSASSFVTAGSWPGRMWEAGRSFAGCLEGSSTLATVSFVEGCAGGPAALKRVQRVLDAFTIFLKEGYEYAQDRPRQPSPLALQAIAWTIFEGVYLLARENARPHLAGLLPHAMDLALTPFLGSAEAGAFLDEKLSAPDTAP